MAFTYRNPTEQAINSLPSKYSDQILSKSADKLIERVDDLNDLFSFHMKKETEELLVSAGVELAPLSFQVHSHPACKTIENHIVYRVLQNCIKKLPSVALVSMRDEKAKRLIKRRNFSSYGKIKDMRAYNACIDWKDRYRYINPNEESFSSRESIKKYADECTAQGWFPKTIFMHDELHFWSPEEVMRFFLMVPETQTILATIVCPIELITGDEHSRNPRIYTFEKDGGSFHYFPDGVSSEGYRQEIEKTTWPLLYSTLRGSDLELRVSVVYSLYSHHLISIERGCIPQNTLFLPKPDALMHTELSIISGRLCDSTIERSTMSSILLYLSCLKNPNKQSALAKLKQLERRDLFPDEMYLVSTLASTFIKYGVGNDLDDSIFSKLLDETLGVLPNFLGTLLSKDRVWKSAFRDFHKELAVKHLKIKRKIYDCEFNVISRLHDLVSKTRKEAPYSFKREVVHEGFISLLGPIFHDGKNVIKDEHLKLTVDYSRLYGRSTRTEIIVTPYPLLISDKAFSEEKIDNSKETFSSNGLVVADFMNPEPSGIEKLSIKGRKNACVVKAIATFLRRDADILLNELIDFDLSPDLFDLLVDDLPITLDHFNEIGIALNLHLICKNGGVIRQFNLSGSEVVGISLEKGHATAMSSRDFALEFQREILLKKDKNGGVFKKIELDNRELTAISPVRAKKLLESIMRGSTGILKSVSESSCVGLGKYIDCLDFLIKDKISFNVDLGLLLGAPGSGKTKKVKDLLNHDLCNLSTVISPRRALSEDWVKVLKGTVHKVFTFETALIKSPKGAKRVILDESSLYPPGYLDLISLISVIKNSMSGTFSLDNPKKVALDLRQSHFDSIDFIMLGDPLQTFYYCETDSLLLDKKHCLTRAIENLKKPMSYLWYSYRLPQGFDNLIDMPCLGKKTFVKPKFFADTSAVKSADYSAILVASHEDKRNISVPIVPMTFGESQGLTFEKKSLILLSDDVLRVSPNALLVALTRSEEGFDFVLSGTRGLNEFKKLSDKRLLGYVLQNIQISRKRLTAQIPAKEIKFIEAFGNLEDKASNDVFILPEIQPDYVYPEEDEMEKIEIMPPWIKCHIPLIGADPLLAEIFEKMEAKERREFWHTNSGSSEQFPDTDKGLIECAMGAGFRYSSIFPKHSADDNVTFWEGVKKRLSFSNPREERTKLEESRKYGRELCDIFFSKMPNEFKVTSEDIELGVNSFNAKREQKAASLWANHSERSDIDWPLNHIFLFMKSQLCTKEEKMFSKAKAGQTLACFHHLVLFRMGPMLRAIERAFLRANGESYYVHSGKNFFCLNEFVLKNASTFDGRSLESDYEAFDSSQDTMILAFELALLERLGVSRAFISDYESLKINLGCRLGSMAVMRFTGEFCTFLFNTFANMLFTFLKYDVKKERDRILFAGDDMCSLGSLKRNVGRKEKLLSLFQLKAKEKISDKPMFCGWFLTPEGILKSPKLLWARICVMKEKGALKDCIDSYFLEAIFAYNLGERLYFILGDEELEYHYAVTRFFIQEKRYLVGEARRLAFGSLEDFGCECRSSESMNSSLEANQRISKLKLSRARMSTVMPVSLNLRSSIAYEDSSQTSRSLVLEKMAQSFLTFSSLTKLRSNMLEECQVDTTTFTLELFLLRLHLFSQIRKTRVGPLCYMMVRLSIQRRGISHRTTSTSRKGLHSLYYALDTAYLALTLTYVTAFEWFWKCLGLATLKEEKSFLLILGLCTGWLILPGFLETQVEVLGGASRRYKVQSILNLVSRRAICLHGTQGRWKLKCLAQTHFHRVEISSYLRGTLVPENIRHRNVNSDFLMMEGVKGSYLSQLHCMLKVEEMSTVEAVFHLNVKNLVNEFVWINLVNTGTGQLQNLEATATEADRASFRKKRTAWNGAYIKSLFGNVAVLGSSAKTEWPNVDVTVGPILVRDGEENISKTMTLNLSTAINRIEIWRSTHEDATIKNATFRQICEAFAAEAKFFLKSNFSTGVVTNIYKKWPRALESAPWVAFDFCSGLDYHKLQPDEKKVIDRLTKRLFRTEGQKSVYEAGAETNVDIEG